MGDRRRLGRLIASIVVAAIVGIVLALVIDWFPRQASTQAGPIDTLYDVLLVVSVPMFAVVVAVVLFSVRTFRMRAGQEDQDGPPIHGNTRLEVVWTIIPAVLMVALSTYAYVVLRDIEETPAAAAREMTVGVTAQQFAWSFTYPRDMTGGRSVTTSELVLPRGRPVEFELEARDVIHDFWVPEFRVKMDAVPGVTTRYRVTPDRDGTYPVVCAELCGLGHSTMRSQVRVVAPAAFERWLGRQGRPAESPAGGGGAGAGEQAAAGRQVFAGTGCGSCHQLADAGGAGRVGPNLDEVLAGQSAAQVRESIVEPEAEITEGYPEGIMPGNYGDSLSAEELDALVGYLREQAGE